ncbi:calcium-binding protein [Fibrobacter sp. UWB10]|uniref:calcium-binding protein n=1 Tax=Fibrobacter sp. UWB10 TaxID=1896201 RepID=UPI0024030370|nr:calcium-binding protein [Fibrobacter sp. UWB10]SMP38087.1 Ca2+-binding protein, RTX toxin-related [Fibrobacter sp. UWB10]
MSKKNVKKNKKNSTRKNYKIEALEPRLMMDASADNWLAENALTQSTQMNSFVDNICASSAAGENDVFEGVKKIDGDKIESVKIKDLIGAQSMASSLKFGNDFKNIHNYIENCVEECRKDACATECLAYQNAEIIYEALLKSSKSTPEEIKAAKDAKDASWQIYQNKLKTAVVTTDDLYTKLTDARTKPVNTSFAKDGNGAIVVEFSGNKTSVEQSLNSKIVPEVSEETLLDVKFEDSYVQENRYKWSFKIDGDVNNGIEQQFTAATALHFKQDQGSGKNDAKLGTLGLLSKADTDETLPDFSVVGSFVGGQNITPKYEKAYNVDLNFALDNTNGLLDNNLTLNSPSDLCLNGVGISSLSNASWGANDDLMSKIKHIQMGNVLNLLNDMSYTLIQKAINNEDLLKQKELDGLSGAKGLLDQKSSTLIDISAMFDPIIKNPPATLQELLIRLKSISDLWYTANNLPVVSVEASILKAADGSLSLKIPFLLFSGKSSEVSLSTDFLNKIIDSNKNGYYAGISQLDAVKKNSLAFDNTTVLEFDVNVALTNTSKTVFDSSSKLKDVLYFNAEENINRLSKSFAVLAEDELSSEVASCFSENVDILLKAPDGTEKTISYSKGSFVENEILNNDIVAKLTSLGIVASGVSDENHVAIMIDPANMVQMNILHGVSREIGVVGQRSFENAYCINLNTSTGFTIDGKSYVVGSNDFNMKMRELGCQAVYIRRDDAATPVNYVVITNCSGHLTRFGGGANLKTMILYRSETNELLDKTLLSKDFTLKINLTKAVYDVNTKTNVNVISVSFKTSDFSTCSSSEDVARVINKKLSEYRVGSKTGDEQSIYAEIVDGVNGVTLIKKLAFRCADQSINVALSEDVVGFKKNVIVNSSSDCIRLKFTTGEIYDVDLYYDLNEKLVDNSNKDLTVDDLLKIIQANIKKKYGNDVIIENDSFKDLESVEDLNGFMLATALGLTENRKYVKPETSLSKVSLGMAHVIHGNVDVHANMGLFGVDCSGDINYVSFYTNVATDWNDFLNGKHETWTYGVDPFNHFTDKSQLNKIKVSLSQGMGGGNLSLGEIRLLNATNSWNGNFIASNLVSVLEGYGQTMQMSDVVLSVSDKLTKFLSSKIVDNEFLKKNIPLLGKSATDVLGIYAKVSELISELQRNTPATLQELSARLENALGAKLAFSIEQTGIKVSFDWTKDVGGNKVAIGSLALGSDKVYVGGNAEAYLNGNVHVILDMIVKPSRNVGGSLFDVEIKDTSSVDFKVYMKGNPLKFDLSVSGGGLSASLLKVVSTNDKPSYLNMMAHMKLDFNLKDDKFVLDNTTDFRVGGELHVECAGLNIGSVKLGVYGDDASTIECWDGNEGNQSGSFEISRLTDINVVCNRLGLASDQSKEKKGNLVLNLDTANIDFEKFSFFQKLRLVADGLGSVLRKAQLGVSNTFVSDSIRKIPMVGDAIVAGADCLTELDSKFIEPFRKYVYGDHELDAGIVAEYLYDMLSNAGLLKNLDKCSESSKIAWAGTVFDKYFTRDENNGVVQYNYDAQKECAEWRVCIGGEYTLNANGDFDIGFSGLGLRGEGGVETKFEWKWNIGFGISKTEGAYILLSNGTDVDDSAKKIKADGFKVKAEKDGDPDIMTGDDIELTLTITPTAIANASLGFLKAGVNVSSNAQTLRLGVDLNDGKNGSDSLVNDKLTDKGKDPKIKISDLGKALSVEANLTGKVEFVAHLTLGLDTTAANVSIGFPELGADFEMKWSAKYGDIAGELESLGFKNIYLDTGSFAKRVLEPMLGKIKKVVEPLQPLIDFLQMEIPVINKLPIGAKHIKMLDIVKSFAKGKVDLGFLDDVVQISNLISNYSSLKLDKIQIGQLMLASAGNSGDINAISGVTGFDVSSLLNNSKIFTKDAGYDNQLKQEQEKAEKFFGKNNGTYGWAFPIIQSPAEQVIKLLLGQHADLVTYRMQPLVFETQWGKNFPIVGPLCADIGFNFGADIQLAFGYDTLGFENWKDSHFKDFWALMDGFYINDYDENGVDIAEVIFHSGITAGASVGGIAGINVGVDLDLNLNFDDPNNDGKIRLQELARNLSLNPLTIFDASVTMEIEAFAYINYFIGSKKFDLWKSGAIELFNTDRGDADEPVLTTEQNGDIYINIGDYAAKRNKGDLSDNADSVTIKVKSATSFDVTYNGKTQSVTIGENCSLYIYAGEHNDVIKFETENSAVAKFNIIIDGGTGDDEIDLSKVTLNDSCIAVVIGGLGADIIYGASGRNFLFGETVLPLQYKKDDQEKIGDVLCAESYPDDGSAEINKIVANGTKKNVIFGGAGSDIIVGGLGADVIFGDGGRYINGIADRYDIFENGGDDIIYGRSGEDYIMGGAGDDTICGGNDRDYIFGGLGKDLISGGAGDDEIDAGDGVDVVFGDALPQGINDLIKKTFRTGYIPETLRTGLSFNSVSIAPQNISSFSYTEAAVSQFGNDVIYGGDGSDVIFGDNGQNNGDNGGNDRIYGGSGNDLIDGDAGNDYVDGGIGEDVIYGGQGDDTLDGGADNDIVFGDDGFNGKNGNGNSDLFVGRPTDDNQNKTFGQSISKFAREFGYTAFTKAVDKGGNDIIMAGNGSDIVDGQSGEDTYKVKMMDNGNLAYTNVMDSGENDKQDSMIIDGTVNADDFLIRASTENLGFVAKLPSQKDAQIQRVNFWKKDDAYYGIENISLNAGAGNDNIAIDGTLSTISIDAGAGNDYITVGQMFNSVRESGDVNSNVLPKDSFETTKTTKGYLSNGVEHSTSIVGGEGNDTFNLLHNTAAISLAGGAGKDTFNVALFQEVYDDGTKSIIENGPVTLIGGADTDKMSIIGSDGDDTFVLSQGKVLGNGIDILSVSIENKNVYGGDGDDSFYVLDSVENEVTKLYGNKGNDSFYNGGAGTAEVPDITANSKNSDPNAIGVDFYSADGKNKLELAKSTLDEDGVSKTVYKIKLDKAPKAGEIVSVTIFAPGETSEALERGDRGIWLAYNNADGVECYCKSITYKFAASADNSNNVLAWNSLADVKLVAFGDSAREGDDYFSLLHNVTIESTSTDAAGDNTLSNLKDCKNALIFFNELDNSNDFTNQFSVTDEYLLTSTDVANKSLTCYLKALPEEKDIVAWLMHDGSPVSIPVSELKRIKANNGLVVNCETMPINDVDESGNPTVSTACWPVGTKFYFNYKSDVVYVEESSVVQMANSTDGMTAHLIYVPFDKSIGQYDEENACVIIPKMQRNNVGNYSYYYETAGTQIIICSVSTGKPIQINGNLYLAWTEHENPTSVTIKDELDSYKESSIQEIKDRLTDDTIADIKGPMYEDGAGKEASLGDHDLLMIHYGEIPDYTEGSEDEQNGINNADQKARKAAEEEAAKFDEGNSKDRIFVNNRNNTKAGVKNDLDAMSIKVKNSATTDEVVLEANAEWLDSDKHSLRLDHKDAGASVTNQFNIGNMEYAEINLGQGIDNVDVHKTIYREDDFQTFTVVNSGKGGDTVNVHSYAEEKSDKIATLKNLSATNYNGSIKNVVAYNVSGLTFCEGKSAATLTSIKNANATAENNDLIDRNRVFLNVEFSDGTLQRREVVLDEYDVTKMLLLKRGLTPVADGVSIVSIYLANGYQGDGLLVVNAQSGDDTINAMGDNDADGKSKVTREGMVVIGGTGNDTLKVNTNVIAFGDRGQVIYENEKGEVVTRLGSLDVDSSITKDDVLDQYDYTTPSAKTQKVNGQDVAVTNYFQTDGVVRDPKYIHSVSEKVGGTDVIIANGDRNVVLGGAGADTITLNGSDNVAVGDNGEVKFANSDVVKNASGDVVNHVYGDSTKTYLNYVQSTFDTEGDKDTITTKDGKNVVIGGTASDKIATGDGNDIIIGDGGEAYVDRNREALLVSNQGRNLDGNSAGSDVIKTSGGDNVIFGGLNSQSRDFDFVKNEESGKWETTSVAKNNEDLIVSGSGKDVVFGDNAYATFKGNSSMANGMENMPTIYSEATLSFNFQGPAQNGIGANEKAGTDDYAIRTLNKETNRVEETTEHAGLHVGNWNNIKGHEAGTYGDNDDEIVLFDNGSRASAVSVTYGASEDHRVNTTDGDQIRLHGYTQEGRFYASNSGDYNLMKSGLDTSGNNARNVLLTQVDGLNQYFTDYDVVVYLDMVRENSWAHDSVRVVTLYRDYVENGVARSEWVESYYVNDPEDNSFNGKWVVATATSAKDAKKRDKNGHLVEQANCVIFKNISGDRFHVEITDGDGENGYNNGKDRAGIAGIQVKGRLHKQDVAASTDIVHGGNDNINTQGGDDVVVGGTGADKIRTFGDDRYGIYDNDVVYGDNAKMVFTDRDSNLDTASTISYAESIASKNLSANYNDSIMTGDGNDVVVGGSGTDKIDSGATAQADEKLDGLEVFSLNFTDVSSNQSTLISKGEAAGVVADNDWHNAYLYNGQSRVHEVDRNNDEDTEKALQKITFQYDCYGNTSAPTEVTNASMDADTGNNKMMMNYVGGHNQDSLTVRLNNIPEKFTANKYDVYVYIDGINNDSDAHGYVFKITGPKGKTYYLNDWSGNRFDGEFKEVTCTEYNRDMFKDGVTPSVEMIGNYVVFRDVDSKEFTVTLECFETTYGTQRRNDLPVISAVQLVAGANRKADIAVGGDHDKDFVVGDDATLHFDLDIPFAGDESIGDYQNRLVSAKSTSVSGSANSDKIWTGKDRDVVIGGEGNDQIDAGAGDDVVIGNTVKNVYVEHNNPVGVFRPNVNIVLEDNDYNVAEPRPYLDGQGGNKDQIRSMVQGGQIEGIKLDNQNTGYDTVYGGNNNKDLVFINGHTEWGNLAKEMTSDSFFGVQKDDVHALPTPPAPAEVDPVSGNEEPTGTDQPISGGDDPVTGNEDPITGNEDPQNEVDYSETIISPVAFADLKLDANKKVKLVFETYPQFNDHIANLHLYFTGKNGKMFDDVTVELYSHGRLYRYDVGGNYWVGVDVQDRIDGDSAYGDGNCVLYIVSEKETAFTLSIGE